MTKKIVNIIIVGVILILMFVFGASILKSKDSSGAAVSSSIIDNIYNSMLEENEGIGTGDENKGQDEEGTTEDIKTGTNTGENTDTILKDNGVVDIAKKREANLYQREVLSNKTAYQNTLNILNIEVLGDYIPNDRQQLREIYYNSDIILDSKNKVYAYIDEDTIVVKRSTVSFNLIDADSRETIIKIESEYLPSLSGEDDFIEFENIDVLYSYYNYEKAAAMLNVHYAASQVVQESFYKIGKCYIDKDSIEIKGDKISFDVYESATKKFLIRATINHF